MDFDYDPYSDLNDFCSNSFDEKIKKEAQKLKEETENLNYSTEILLGTQLKPKSTRKSLDKCLKKVYKEEKKNKEKLISPKKTELDAEFNAHKDPKYITKKIGRKKKNQTNANIEFEEKKKEDSTKITRKTKRPQISVNKEPEEIIELEDNFPELNFESSSSQRGRARRNYMANLASSLPTQEVIDLESYINNSVSKSSSTNQRRKKKKKTNTRRRSRPTNLIVIGSDSGTESEYEEIKFNTNTSLIPKMNCKDDEDNPDIQILIEWDHKIEKLQIRKYQKFQDIIDLFAKKENVSAKDILLNLNDNIIIGNDTVDNINYKFGDIINGRIVENCQSYVSNILNTAPKAISNKNQICLKIQSNHWKNPFEMFIEKNDSFKILYIQCAETFKLNINDFMLIFDGDQLVPNETPKSLDMEGGEIIDCVIKK